MTWCSSQTSHPFEPLPHALSLSRAYCREMPPNPEKRSNARWRLVVSATSAFAHRGFHRASLTDIATEAGVTTGSIYSHFRDKEDLFAAVVDNLASDLCVEFRRIDRLRGYGGDAAADAAARFRALLDVWPEWPLLVHEVLSLRAHGRDQRDAAEIAASCEAVHRELALTLEQVAGRSGIQLARPARAGAAGRGRLTTSAGMGTVRLVVEHARDELTTRLPRRSECTPHVRRAGAVAPLGTVGEPDVDALSGCVVGLVSDPRRRHRPPGK